MGSVEAQKLAAKRPGVLYSTAGVHPHDARVSFPHSRNLCCLCSRFEFSDGFLVLDREYGRDDEKFSQEARGRVSR